MFSKSIRKIFLTGLFLCLWTVVLPSQEEGFKLQGIERLESQIQRLVQGLEGTVGIAAKHLESGQEILINGTTFFPMASVFKVPVFVEVMAQVMEGKFTLQDEVSLQVPDQHLGSGMLSGLDVPGITLSMQNLINLMMKISDNSATDILVTKVGVANVNRRLESIGVEGMTVDRTCQDLILEAIGADPERYRGLGLEEVTKGYRKELRDNPEAFEEATEKFSQVIKDQSTPQAMNALLEKIFKKEILNDQNCDYILSVMLECDTGERRIKGDLPRRARVAHKTGTIGGTVNDVGIIYLPDGVGHVALTIFTKDTEEKTGEVEDVIAQIARFVFDYFYFTAE
jgi:beta-lactamase class A